MKLSSIILAAGQGTRMKSKFPKVLHKIMGKSLASWVIDAASECGAEEKVLVVGAGAELVRDEFGDSVQYAVQEQQLGTGHAVAQASEFIGKAKTVVVLCGDAPLITGQTLKSAYEYHVKNGNVATILTAELENPYGYGRITDEGIVEERDATPAQKLICEINSGMYFFESESLLGCIERLTDDNTQGEYYLTQTIEILLGDGEKVGKYKINSEEIYGINDRAQLSEAAEVIRMRIIQKHMENGVTIIDPKSTYISVDATIGMDTMIYPQTFLEGPTQIGEDCVIRQSRIFNSTVGNGTDIENSVVLKSSIGNGTHIGPFAYLRPNSAVGDNIKIGDFVEIKNSVIGNNTKISHLSYVGDADVGESVNLGCGVVVVNYDGAKKYRSVVKDNSFVGCNVNLVSPVTLNKNCFIAAGSTITQDVPENSLAIARSYQTIKENWKGRKK